LERAFRSHSVGGGGALVSGQRPFEETPM
jgi:hypothetical protein